MKSGVIAWRGSVQRNHVYSMIKHPFLRYQITRIITGSKGDVAGIARNVFSPSAKARIPPPPVLVNAE
jgi:hypothetical protein